MAKSLGGKKVSNHIPQDLALLILSKLPLKSLKRFGCVRKTWSLLFENFYFITMLRANFISIPHSYYDDDTSLILEQVIFTPLKIHLHLLSGHRFENILKLNLPNPFQEEKFYILESNTATNGTLCLSFPRGDQVILWNPTTDVVNVVPSSSMEFMSPYLDTLIDVHGFGYDHVSDDYKIIRYITYFLKQDEDHVDLVLPPQDEQSKKLFHNGVWEIYSLKCNTWETLDVNMPVNLYDNILYTNDGICHWLSRNEALLCLVSFNCNNYVFFTTNTPLTDPTIDPSLDFEEDIDPNFEFEFVDARLVMLNGSIALISWNSETPTFHISILGELGVSESWTELFIIGPFPYIRYPIIAGRDGNIFFRKKDGDIVCFDLSTHKIKELDGLKEAQSDLIAYTKKLILIGGINH